MKIHCPNCAKTLAVYDEVLAETGFRVTEIQGVGRVPYLWKSIVAVARKA